MRTVLTLTLEIALALGVIVTGGCKSATEKQFEAEQIIIEPPLENDPTDPAKLARWWSNGSNLLLLDGSSAYTMFEGTNRYSKPIERGRWSQQSYAALWLEPDNT